MALLVVYNSIGQFQIVRKAVQALVDGRRLRLKVTPDDRRRLEAIVSDRDAPEHCLARQKSSLQRPTAAARPRYRQGQAGGVRRSSFMAEGVEGPHDQDANPQPAAAPATVQRVVDFTPQERPTNSTAGCSRRRA